jgi:acetolactate synthase-1/2/3 large subunit
MTRSDPNAQDAKQLPGAEILWEILALEGVEIVFGYPGGAIMPAYDALPKYPQIHHVLARHEQGAIHMADGFARASGRTGVVIATSGPGATNLVTGLGTAMMDRIPLVAVTGQVPSTVMGSDAFQETDILGITIPVTKHGFLVTRAQDIAPTLREAFALAKSGRPGPVLVDITKDALNAIVGLNDPGPATIRRPRIEAPGFSDADLDAAAALIAAAKRPLILAGQGVIAAKATAQLEAFVERTDMPVACTLLGLGGFSTQHTRNLGMMGMHGEAWVNKAIQQADLLVAIGMRFDDRVTGNLKTYALEAKKIHIEFDPSEINKVVKVDVGLCGDAAAVLDRLLPKVAKRDCAEWIASIAEMHVYDRTHDILVQPDDGRLKPPQVLHDLWMLTEGRAVVATDVGQHQMWEAQYYKHDTPRSLITSGGLGTMGFALPAAIGAKFARPEAEVWVVAGDGGFQMTAAELCTTVQEGVKVNIAIINNGFLGMVRQWQQFFYERRYVSTPMLSPDFVKLAEAHGLTGIRVTSRDQIPAAVAKARATPGTVLIEFQVVEEESVYPMVPAGKDLADMIRRPKTEAS